MELDIVRKEHNVPDILGSKENHQLPHVTCNSFSLFMSIIQ